MRILLIANELRCQYSRPISLLRLIFLLGTLCALAYGAHGQNTQLSGNLPLARFADLAAEKLGISIRYDPGALNRTITIRSTKALTDDELWIQFNEALSGIEFTTILHGQLGSYEVVPLRDAANRALIEYAEHDNNGVLNPGFRSVIISSSPLDASSAVSLIQPLVSASVGKAVALPGSDEILISDFTQRVSTIRAALERAQNEEGEVVVEVIRSPPGRSVEFVSSIKQLVDRQQSAGGKPLRGDVIATADNTSVSVVAPVEELPRWLSIANQAWPNSLESMRYLVPDFDSETLSAVLSEAIQAQSPTPDEVTIFANSFTGSVTVTADELTHTILKELVEELRQLPAGARFKTERLDIRQRVAQDIADQLTRLLDADELQTGSRNEGRTLTSSRDIDDTEAEELSTQSGTQEPSSGPLITVDESTNSLLVTGTPSQIASVRTLTNQLDTPISQVMIEVLLVSLSDSETLDLGVELEKIEVGGGTLYRLSSLFGLGTDAAASELPAGSTGLTGVVLDPGEFSVLVRALETVNEGRSLSMPRVLVANSQEAEFNSVTQQPILSTNTSDVIATTSFGGFEDAGTTISIAPQILAGEQLNLDYSVTLSAFIGDSSDPALPPPRQQNQLSSAITIPDSYTVAVGGIELDTFGDAESRVPWIGRVPVIGEFFKNRSKSRSKTKFYVFIRASIYQDELFEQLRYASDQLANDAGIPTGWPIIEPRVIR
ncbi:MAG: hypothetical protein ED559_05155 [Phycisphaera sp.]|nr:MAG: hypothetical protein ED559_05155 [Phycisphaera sp.]